MVPDLVPKMFAKLWIMDSVFFQRLHAARQQSTIHLAKKSNYIKII